MSRLLLVNALLGLDGLPATASLASAPASASPIQIVLRGEHALAMTAPHGPNGTSATVWMITALVSAPTHDSPIVCKGSPAHVLNVTAGETLQSARILEMLCCSNAGPQDSRSVSRGGFAPVLTVESGPIPFPPLAQKDPVNASTSNARHQVSRSAGPESFALVTIALNGDHGPFATDWAQ
jgi:hypothetical protein